MFIKYFFKIVEFSIIPLWTTETLFDECGCAFRLLGTPWVAHLTWPMPIEPSIFCDNKLFSNLSTLPSVLISWLWIRYPLLNGKSESKNMKPFFVLLNENFCGFAIFFLINSYLIHFFVLSYCYEKNY